jgi:hypothetical protein
MCAALQGIMVIGWYQSNVMMTEQVSKLSLQSTNTCVSQHIKRACT